MTQMLTDIAFSSIRIATPLIFAARGGLYTFQAGILNIALDGFMTVAAFAAVSGAYATGSLIFGVLAGVVSSVALAAVLALFNLRFRAHIFIAGIAVTLLAYGLRALLLKSVLGQNGVFTSPSIPVFPPIRIPG
jgi:general nucleoside transport system permease protein